MKGGFDGISFIIPAYNEEKYIRKAINAIINLGSHLSLPYEIIVINNGSTDKTYSIAKSLPCEVINIEKRKVSFARNYGAQKSRFSLLAFIDGDTVITERWIFEMENFIKNHSKLDKVLTGCPVSIPKEPTWIESSWFNSTSKNYIGGANIICTKFLFKELGGFDETLETGEDYDFCKRAERNNTKLYINPNFEAIHLGFPSSITEFSKREAWHGKGDCKNIKTFFNSKVSLMALFYFIIVFFILYSLVFLNIQSALYFLAVLFVINFFLTFKRFGLISFDKFFFNYFLNFIYFLSRNISLLYVLKDKISKV